MKKTIEERMKEEIKFENDARSQKAVVEAVVECSDLDIPETMIEREFNLLMEQIKMQFEQSGQSFEEIEKMDDFKALQDSKKDEASTRVLHSLVLGAVVRAEDMTVQEEELTSYLNEYVRQNNIPPDRYSEFFQDEYIMRQISEEVLTSKVVEYLVENAEISFVPDDTEDGEEKKSKAKKEKSSKPKKTKSKKESKDGDEKGSGSKAKKETKSEKTAKAKD